MTQRHPSHQPAMDRRRFLRMAGFTAGSVYLGALLAACATTPAETPPAPSGGTTQGGQAPAPMPLGVLNLGIDRNLNRIDPRLSTSVTDIMVCWDLFDGLVQGDANGNFQPSLAAALPSMIDPKTYEVSLRQGVKFHDGTELTAEDVKYTVDTINNPDFKSLFTRIYGFIEGVEIKDKHSLVFHLERPTGPFLERLANLKIVSMAAAERLGQEFEKNPVGSGPFVFDSWIPNGAFTYTRNANYWQAGIPKLEKVVRTVLAEDSTRVAQLQTGQVDLILPAPYQTFPTLQGEDIMTGSEPGTQYSAIRFNSGSGPFANKQLRQALAHAIDREALIQAALGGLAVAADQQVPPWHWAYNPNGSKYAYDPERSKFLMREAGFPNGFEFEMLVGTVSDIKDQATVLQEQFAKVGIKMSMNLGEVEALYQLAFKQEYHAHLHGGNTSVLSPDPDILYRWIYGGPVDKNQFLWWSGPGPEAIVREIDAAVQVVEQDARLKAYHQLQDMINEELPMITLNYRHALAAWRKNVSGFVVTPRLVTDLWNVAVSA